MVIKSTEKVFWTALNEVPAQYPWLKDNIECEVAVVGCGVTAALCALRFAQAGYNTVMLGASAVGYGGTAVSSGMMSIDGEQCICSLVDKIGADRAMTAVQLMREAIDNIETLCAGFEDCCGFKRMDSLRFADDTKNSETIRREFSLRLHNGIDAQLLANWNAGEQFTFPMEAGVYSQAISAQMDPYKFVHAVTTAAVQQGVRVYENTTVNTICKEDSGCVTLDCARERSVKAQYVLVATGLDTEQHCGGINKTATVYTIVTEPLVDFSGWRGPCQIHSEGAPSVFLTITPDNRIMMGGLGSALISTNSYLARALDLTSMTQNRYEQLEKRLRAMFPAIRGITVEYVYTSRNGRTDDGLPVMGKTPDDERVAYALCCGDDGLLYSEIASRLLLEQYQGIANNQLGLFSPGREWRVKR